MSKGNGKGALVIRVMKDGTPVYEAKWRHLGVQTKRRLGQAWIQPDDGSSERLRCKNYAGWMRRKGYPPEGWLSEVGYVDGDGVKHLGAVDLMAQVMKDHATLMAQPVETRAKTFGAVADEWVAKREADVKDNHLKSSTLTDYKSMLVRPDDPLDGRGRSDASAKKRDDEGNLRERRAWIMRALEDVAVASITTDHVDTLEDTLQSAGLTPATRRKYEVVVSMILDFAAAPRQKYIAANPLKSRPKEKRPRKRQPAIDVYSLETVELIAAKAGGQTGEIIRVAAMTGLRQGELLGLRWADVDFTAQSITVRITYNPREGEDVPKSGAARTVPLSDQAGVVLDRVSRRENWTKPRDLIFPNDLGKHTDASTLRRSYMDARKAVIAKAVKDGDTLPTITYHGLRHTFGSRCAAAGVPLVTLMSWMGHANIATTMIYVHWQPQADDAARLTRAFGGTVEQVEQGVTA